MQGGRLVCAFAVALLAACAPRFAELPPTGAERPAEFPAQDYQRAAAAGRPVFRIDPGQSLVILEVRRAGSLARLGHDHVVASHDVQGYVLPDAGRADLFVPLDRMVVDEPQLRAEAGFDTHPSAEDIAGTRRNMLQRVLEAELFPFAVVGVRDVAGGASERMASVSITLHGTTRAMRVPLQVDAARTTLDVNGRLTLEQTAFGIAPLSILGGAIQVRDAVDLRFRIHARLVEPLAADALRRDVRAEATVTNASKRPAPRASKAPFSIRAPKRPWD
ncbi:MAG TPA: YceI family protein [Casimicrobiaceae bacterium]